MENEKMIMMLTELLDGQKEITQSQHDLSSAIGLLKANLERIEKVFKSSSNKVAENDNKHLEQLLVRELNSLRTLIEAGRPKQVQNNLRIFLESDAKKWAVYLVVAFTFLTYLYWFATHK